MLSTCWQVDKNRIVLQILIVIVWSWYKHKFTTIPLSSFGFHKSLLKVSKWHQQFHGSRYQHTARITLLPIPSPMGLSLCSVCHTLQFEIINIFFQMVLHFQSLFKPPIITASDQKISDPKRAIKDILKKFCLNTRSEEAQRVKNSSSDVCWSNCTPPS